MHITFAPKGILQIDDARIIWPNFAGHGDKYNREGDRHFTLLIDNEEVANAMIEDKNKYGVGWNVRIKPPRDEDEDPFITMKVKVKFSASGPNVYLKTGKAMIRLDEDSIECLDKINIASVRLDIRPYDDLMSGKPFRAAYLHSMCVTQAVEDRFADEYDSYRN